jgi:hypothetical protein
MVGPGERGSQPLMRKENSEQHEFEVVDTQEGQVTLRLTPMAERENATRYSNFCQGCESNPRGFVEGPSYLRTSCTCIHLTMPHQPNLL